MGKRLVQGVGVYEKGKYASKANGKHGKEYKLWQNMLERCYSEKLHARHPTYIGCEVSENFKNFQWFAEWCQAQIGFKLKDYQMDKDIFGKGNKLYSENTCFFIPRQVNTFLTKRKGDRGSHPIGVDFYKVKGMYRATASDGRSLSKHLGFYNTPEEAFQAYKGYKESLAKELATKYEGMVHSKVVEALNNFTVEITD